MERRGTLDRALIDAQVAIELREIQTNLLGVLTSDGGPMVGVLLELRSVVTDACWDVGFGDVVDFVVDDDPTTRRRGR
jgi:hypothetical protein